MTPPLLSIIVPTKNEERAIEGTLRAIADHLTDYSFELIVSDEWSTDKTLEIAARYAKVLAYRGKERKTIAWGRNQGAEIATGTFLVFIDADVIVPEPNEFFRTALAAFAADPTLAGVTVNLRVFPREATWADNLVFGLVNLTHAINNNLLRIGSSSGEFQMVKRDVFNRLGGFNERLAVSEDNEFFGRLGRAGHTRFLSGLTVFHTGRRAHETGWPRLLWSWFLNFASMKLRGRAHDAEWREVR